MTLLSPIKSSLILVAVLISFSSIKADVVTDYATGKCGRELMTVIHNRCRPTTVSGNIDDASMKSLLVKLYSVNSVEALPDFLADNATIGNAVFRTDNHILSSWFNRSNPDCDLVAADLYNIFPTTYDHRNQRQEMPLFDNSDNRCGKGVTADGMYQVYQPGYQWKGAIARMALYVAAIYGKPSAWPGHGAIIFNDFEEYPLLSERAMAQFLKWHEAYPPDADEKQRAQLISSIQGNINPFIAHPNLAVHIWGEDSDKPYLPNTNPSNPDDPEDPGNPDDPTIPDTKIPLHAIYGQEETIYLYSPFITGNPDWTLDGRPIDNTPIKASDIGAGQHELRFTSATQSGKLIIKINP